MKKSSGSGHYVKLTTPKGGSKGELSNRMNDEGGPLKRGAVKSVKGGSKKK